MLLRVISLPFGLIVDPVVPGDLWRLRKGINSGKKGSNSEASIEPLVSGWKHSCGLEILAFLFVSSQPS